MGISDATVGETPKFCWLRFGIEAALGEKKKKTNCF